MEPKYAPPYPQSFYAFWPKHAVKASILISIIFAGLVVLSFFIQVPMDPAMPPMPNDGMYIPAPEWYLLLLFQPFWYLTGSNAKWIPIGAFWLPVLALAFLLLVPVIFRRQTPNRVKLSDPTKLKLLAGVGLVWVVSMGAVVDRGYQAKVLGCPSCHNPMMGERQALPPANVGEYYRVSRKRQVEVGGYNIGSESHEARAGGGYKDSNWQIRHFYSPTETW